MQKKKIYIYRKKISQLIVIFDYDSNYGENDKLKIYL